MSHRVFIIAGEASGDMYGAYLIRLLKEHQPSLAIRAWGGDKMEAAGADIALHISELSIMGFVEVIKNLPRLAKLFSTCRQHILDFQTETIVFIDFPGFNLRLAPWAKKNNIRTIQYISPKVWAWKENRIKTIKSYIDELICIFPFELDYYKKHQVKAHYFGNPLHQLIQNHQIDKSKNNEQQNIIALFPGSRKQEIRRILPVLVKFAAVNPDYHFIIGAMSLIGYDFYQDIINQHPTLSQLSIEMDNNYDLISMAQLVINTSGTITLETAIFNKPQIAVYKTHPISYALIKQLIKVQFISLPNILSGSAVIPELIQDDFSVGNLQITFDRIINNSVQALHPELQESLEVVDEQGLVKLILNSV